MAAANELSGMTLPRLVDTSACEVMTLARGEVPVPACLCRSPGPTTRLDVPRRACLRRRARRRQARDTLHEIDRVRAAGIRFGRVLADAGSGLSAPFRQGLNARDPCRRKPFGNGS